RRHFGSPGADRRLIERIPGGRRVEGLMRRHRPIAERAHLLPMRIENLLQPRPLRISEIEALECRAEDPAGSARTAAPAPGAETAALVAGPGRGSGVAVLCAHVRRAG